MSNVSTSSELRSSARGQLKGNWGMAVLVTLIYGIITVGISAFTSNGFDLSIQLAAYLASFIISGPLAAGIALVFLKASRQERFDLEDLFRGFSRFVDFFVLSLISGIFILLWTLLLIVPGIIASFRYSQAYYLMLDDPNLKALDAIKLSSNMMKGYKWKLFVLYLSFIGWVILAILTCGIGFLFLLPYISTAAANFYGQLKTAQSPSAGSAQA